MGKKTYTINKKKKSNLNRYRKLIDKVQHFDEDTLNKLGIKEKSLT